jgi:hypothetical protein
MPSRTLGLGLNPDGFCLCGCGERTTLVRHSCCKTGAIFGTPNRYVFGHQRRSSPTEYLEQDCGYETPCWVWQRGKSNGYGIVTRNGKNQYAHRVVYERLVGAVPPGLDLDHLCRNTSCVNPAHLEPVSHGENMRRGRGTRLTTQQVIEIRQRKANGERTVDLSFEFRVDSGYLGKVASGRARQNG